MNHLLLLFLDPSPRPGQAIYFIMTIASHTHFSIISGSSIFLCLIAAFEGFMMCVWILIFWTKVYGSIEEWYDITRYN
jgi:hypothetical protein